MALAVRVAGELERADMLARFDRVELTATGGSGTQRVAAWAAVQDVVAELQKRPVDEVRLRPVTAGPPRVLGNEPVPLLAVSHHGRFAVAVAWWASELPSTEALAKVLEPPVSAGRVQSESLVRGAF